MENASERIDFAWLELGQKTLLMQLSVKGHLVAAMSFLEKKKVGPNKGMSRPEHKKHIIKGKSQKMISE